VTDYPTIPLEDYREYPVEEMRERVERFYRDMARRRTVREFSDRAVPRDIIETALKAAGTAPSGANLQPWHFVAVSDAVTKRKIREAAEVEEREFYEHRASPEWLAALEPLGTDSSKPFLETAPYLIAARRRPQGQALLPDGIHRPGNGDPDHGAAPGGTRDADAHTEPDEVSQRDPRPADERTAVPAAGGGVSRR
jgi:hypothetical protein